MSVCFELSEKNEILAIEKSRFLKQLVIMLLLSSFILVSSIVSHSACHPEERGMTSESLLCIKLPITITDTLLIKKSPLT